VRERSWKTSGSTTDTTEHSDDQKTYRIVPMIDSPPKRDASLYKKVGHPDPIRSEQPHLGRSRRSFLRRRSEAQLIAALLRLLCGGRLLRCLLHLLFYHFATREPFYTITRDVKPYTLPYKKVTFPRGSYPTCFFGVLAQDLPDNSFDVGNWLTLEFASQRPGGGEEARRPSRLRKANLSSTRAER
jgi:hypothetical protein